jgi:hypothetical protein
MGKVRAVLNGVFEGDYGIIRSLPIQVYVSLGIPAFPLLRHELNGPLRARQGLLVVAQRTHNSVGLSIPDGGTLGVETQRTVQDDESLVRTPKVSKERPFIAQRRQIVRIQPQCPIESVQRLLKSPETMQQDALVDPGVGSIGLQSYSLLAGF